MKSILFLLAALCYLASVGFTYHEGGRIFIVIIQLLAAVFMLAAAFANRPKR
jgi:hypothetical protein